MKCPNCGKEIANDSVFCEYCGTRVKEVPKPEPAQAPVPESAPASSFAPVRENAHEQKQQTDKLMKKIVLIGLCVLVAIIAIAVLAQ